MTDDKTVLRYGVLSDTHGRLHPRVFELFDGVQRIYHCGDLGADTILHELQLIAPVSAVHGNMDPWSLAAILPETRIEVAAFGKVIINHGTGFAHNNKSIRTGLLQRYGDEKPRVVLFGHSHEALLVEKKQVLFINPGSATLPHSGAPPTVAMLEYDTQADTLTAKIQPLDEAY